MRTNMFVLGVRLDSLQLGLDLRLHSSDLLNRVRFSGIVRSTRILNRFGDLRFKGRLLRLEFDERDLEFVCCNIRSSVYRRKMRCERNDDELSLWTCFSSC